MVIPYVREEKKLKVELSVDKRIVVVYVIFEIA